MEKDDPTLKIKKRVKVRDIDRRDRWVTLYSFPDCCLLDKEGEEAETAPETLAT